MSLHTSSTPEYAHTNVTNRGSFGTQRTLSSSWGSHAAHAQYLTLINISVEAALSSKTH